MDKKIYVTLIVAVFVAFTVVFDTLPALEPFIRALIGDAVKRGWLIDG